MTHVEGNKLKIFLNFKFLFLILFYSSVSIENILGFKFTF